MAPRPLSPLLPGDGTKRLPQGPPQNECGLRGNQGVCSTGQPQLAAGQLRDVARSLTWSSGKEHPGGDAQREGQGGATPTLQPLQRAPEGPVCGDSPGRRSWMGRSCNSAVS